MRYSELYISYRKYLNDNKKRAISYKEFNEVLAIEGLEVQRTSKKINEEWISGRFIIGVCFDDDFNKEGNMSVMSFIHKSSLNLPSGVVSRDLLHERHKRHEEPTTESELIQDVSNVKDTLKSIIEEQQNKIGKIIPIEDIIKEAKNKDITEDQVEEMIEKLKRSGDVFEPKPGFISLI